VQYLGSGRMTLGRLRDRVKRQARAQFLYTARLATKVDDGVRTRLRNTGCTGTMHFRGARSNIPSPGYLERKH